MNGPHCATLWCHAWRNNGLNVEIIYRPRMQGVVFLPIWLIIEKENTSISYISRRLLVAAINIRSGFDLFSFNL